MKLECCRCFTAQNKINKKYDKKEEVTNPTGRRSFIWFGYAVFLCYRLDFTRARTFGTTFGLVHHYIQQYLAVLQRIKLVGNWNTV